MKDEDIYKEAAKKIRAKKGFIYHLIAFVCIIGMLYAIMYFETGEFLPVIITGLAWGIGLAAHYFKTFGTQHLGFLGINPNWEEEALENEIEQLKRKRELLERLQQEKGLLEETESLELKEIEKRRLDDDFV